MLKQNLQEFKIVSKTEPLASLPLQLVLHTDKAYISWIFFIVTLVSLFYKVFKYNLHQSTAELCVVLLIAVQALNQMRLYIALKSNKVEKSVFCQVLAYFLASLFTYAGYVFFVLVQPVTLLIEVVVVGLALVLGIYELLSVIAVFVEFKSLENSQ